ncbi:uncharacterized protein MONOS_8984 [Monocercomonoides exilis]|uniref:uncharacterized protein n=1 Tax=Monocercomonoides exilis TaxID=2049356 RepID=UPI00355AA6CC|nr:hypothetical protein MONOS_8984 [Monocercomonoides exilis]|eukprot:MONOS_8984.1-p1 / transcript=MONOS_8984.1 / gene=MONOS_8984 / organism=Monocercomonoides_exilis_PA203 / gene_product=unspecified product / transcript_product=unspecified product / location=Mono_scaffold00355:26309-26602(+) / protein_length=98 / sequence_SO=supercontig / SO=protein_coding / is_pseudo=false
MGELKNMGNSLLSRRRDGSEKGGNDLKFGRLTSTLCGMGGIGTGLRVMEVAHRLLQIQMEQMGFPPDSVTRRIQLKWVLFEVPKETDVEEIFASFRC